MTTLEPSPRSKWLARWPLLAPLAAAAVVIWAVLPAPVPEAGALVGRWVREDGGYVLEVKRAGADGSAEVAYLNPKPIHVARAAVTRDGALRLFVELRDEGYPGSTYTLAYDAKEARLTGEYFQAQGGQRFQVSFTRAPQP